MLLKQEKIKLLYGQGYMIHDRKWLHGRDSPSNGVKSNRLYGFVFDNRYTMLEAGDAAAALHVMQAVINKTGCRHLQIYEQ